MTASCPRDAESRCRRSAAMLCRSSRAHVTKVTAFAMLVTLAATAPGCTVDPLISREEALVDLDLVLTEGMTSRMLLTVDLAGEPREVGSLCRLFVYLPVDSAVQSVEVHATAPGFDERSLYGLGSREPLDFASLISGIPSAFEVELEALLVGGGAGEVSMEVHCSVSASGLWDADLTVTLEEVP